MLYNRTCTTIDLQSEIDTLEPSLITNGSFANLLGSNFLSPNESYTWDAKPPLVSDSSTVIYQKQTIVVTDVANDSNLAMATKQINMNSLNNVLVITVTTSSDGTSLVINTSTCSPGNNLVVPQTVSCP